MAKARDQIGQSLAGASHPEKHCSSMPPEALTRAHSSAMQRRRTSRPPVSTMPRARRSPIVYRVQGARDFGLLGNTAAVPNQGVREGTGIGKVFHSNLPTAAVGER